MQIVYAQRDGTFAELDIEAMARETASRVIANGEITAMIPMRRLTILILAVALGLAAALARADFYAHPPTQGRTCSS
jgi:hypothetical protein